MPWWAWTAIGGAYAMGWRISFRTMWKGETRHDWEAFWFCAFYALLFAWVAPVFAISAWAAGRHDPDRVARVVGGESRAMKRERRERELREREERVRELERELGIE